MHIPSRKPQMNDAESAVVASTSIILTPLLELHEQVGQKATSQRSYDYKPQIQFHMSS